MDFDFIEFFQKGGKLMIPIAIIGVIALTIFIERILVLYFGASLAKEKFVNHVERAVLSGDLNSAINYCNDQNGPLNNIVKAGLISVMNKGSDDEVQTSMDVAALKEIPKLEKRTPWLALFGNVAVLIGLLSTVWGMIGAFQAVSGNVDPADKASLLAAAIGVAMHGTAFGLIVAVPSLLASALISSKTQNILDDIHEVSVSLLNLILQNREKFPARS